MVQQPGVFAGGEWGTIVYYPQWNTLELRWGQEAWPMAGDGFEKTLQVLAGHGLGVRPRYVIIDATGLFRAAGEGALAGRDEHMVPPARDLIKSGQAGRVRHLTIDHPPQNTITAGVLRRLAQLVSECEKDDDVRAILLDPPGPAPPSAAGEASAAGPRREAHSGMAGEGQRALAAIEFSSKPVVMAISDGICAGAALELALCCHVRVAGEGTVFAAPGAPPGAAPGWASTHRLIRCFGRSLAFELALTGRQISAAEACALGAVNHVVPGAEVLPKACQIAEAIAETSTETVTAIMAAMHLPHRTGPAAQPGLPTGSHEPQTFVEAITALFEQRTTDLPD